MVFAFAVLFSLTILRLLRRTGNYLLIFNSNFFSLHTSSVVFHLFLIPYKFFFSLSDIIYVSILCTSNASFIRMFLDSQLTLLPVPKTTANKKGDSASLLVLLLAFLVLLTHALTDFLPVFVVWYGSCLYLHDTHHIPVESWDALLGVP